MSEFIVDSYGRSMVEILNYDKISRFHMLVKFFKVYVARYSNDTI